MAPPKGDGKATEATPLLTPPANLPLDDETSAVLRDRVTTSYTTIALVSALLAGVSFLAYATPPSQIFSAAGGSAAAAAIAPPQQQPGRHHPTKSQWEQWGQDAVVITYKALFDIYGVVVPMSFAFNLAGTLTSSGVILFVNSLTATPQLMHSLFGSKEKEHQIMRYPAFFLVGGVCSIFAGFAIGICLYYGLAVAGTLLLVVLVAVGFYECYWARGQSDNYSALNLALGALFFRSCLPDLGEMSDNHEHLNLPPLPPSKEELEEEKKEKKGEHKAGEKDVEKGGQEA